MTETRDPSPELEHQLQARVRRELITAEQARRTLAEELDAAAHTENWCSDTAPRH